MRGLPDPERLGRAVRGGALDSVDRRDAGGVQARCVAGLLRLWGVGAGEYFAEAVAERDAARGEFADAAAVRDEALRSVERLEGELAGRVQELHDMDAAVRERDATIRAARAGRLDTPDVAAIAAQVKEALLIEPRPDAKKPRQKIAAVEAA